MTTYCKTSNSRALELEGVRTAAGSRHRREAVLPGPLTAVALAVMLLAAGDGAYAGSPTPVQARIKVNGTFSTDGYLATTASQANDVSVPGSTGSIDVTLTNIKGGTTETATPTGIVRQPGSSSDSSNSISASATGNDATNGLDGLGPDETTGSGIAALTFSTNGPTSRVGQATTITSTVVGSSLAQSTKGDDSDGSLSQSANQVGAKTIGNLSNSTSNVSIPSAPMGAAGSVLLGSLADLVPLTASASVVEGTVQQNFGVSQDMGSGASLTNNTVTQIVSPGGTVATSLGIAAEMLGNMLSTIFTANDATNGVSAAPQLGSLSGGSIAVANDQANLGSSTITGTAVASGAASNNQASRISTSIASPATAAPVTLDGGSVKLQDNAISSLAIGNNAVGGADALAGNAIALTGDQSFTGSGVAPGNSISPDQVKASADLTLANKQTNDTAALSSKTTGGNVTATVQNSTGSMIGLDGNQVTATVAGNNGSNAVSAASTSDADIASIKGTIALASDQSNSNSPLSATLSGNRVSAILGTDGPTAANSAASPNGTAALVKDSSAAITGSALQASAFGSLATNTVAADATDLDSGNAALADLAIKPSTTAGSSSATADLSLNNVQNSIGSRVTANNVSSTVNVIANSAAPVAGTNLNDQLSISGSVIGADAHSNKASNALSATAQTLSDSAGLVNTQSDQSGATASLSGSSVALDVNSASTAAVSGTSLILGTSLDGAGTGNTLQANAYGNQGLNTLATSATTLDVPAPGGAAAIASTVTTGSTPTVKAAAGLLSSQSATTTVVARINNTKSPFSVSVGEVGGGGVTDSTVANAGNGLMASAYANQVSNLASVDAATVPQNGSVYTPLANLTNVQSASGGVSATIAAPATGALFATTINGPVVNSTAGVMNNTVLSDAESNRASDNQLSVSGTTIDDASPTALKGLSTDAARARSTADLAYTVQNMQKGASSTSAAVTGTGAQLTLGGDVSGSNGKIQNNQFSATAYKNTATNNTLTVGSPDAPVTTLAASGGVQNVQTSVGTTSASVGLPATATQPATPLLMQIQTAGDIDGATLSVDGNIANASAVSNNAANLVSVNATTLAAGAGMTPGDAQAAVGAHTTATADYTASNDQSSTGATTATVSSGVSLLNTKMNPAISQSTLSVSNNVQKAAAEANVATTELDLASTNSAGVTGALVNHQATIGNGDVSAISGGVGSGAVPAQLLQAPVSMSASSLEMSGNSNMALGVANDAANTVNVTGTNVLGASPLNATALGTSGTGTGTANADYSLANVQSVSGASHSISAVANSQIGNLEGADTLGGSVTGSSVALNNNATTASAYANHAANTLNLSGGTLSQSGALVNSQGNQAMVQASSTAMFGTNLKAANGSSASSDSSIEVNDNALQAQAVGNYAANALNATPSVSYGAQGAGALGASSGLNAPRAAATYALSNQQSNSGAINAVGTAGSAFSVALNGSAGSLPVSNSSLSVQGNQAAVNAFGNSADNTLTLVALNTGSAPGALNSVQTNTGAVSASASNLNFGVNVGGAGLSGSTLTVGGNSITAHAVGNAVSNTVTAHR